MAAVSSMRFAILQDLKLRLNFNSPVYCSQEEDATVRFFKNQSYGSGARSANVFTSNDIKLSLQSNINGKILTH
jgi:hypothetical protein